MQAMSAKFKYTIVLFLLLFITEQNSFARDDSTRVRKTILKLARKISRSKTVDTGPVGFAAEHTKQFDRYIYLINNATENELVVLTDHKDPKVRAYSFEILVAKGYKNIQQLLQQHIGDTATIVIRDGCMRSTEHLNLYWLRLATPRNNEHTPAFKLTDTEVSELKEKMNRAIGTR